MHIKAKTWIIAAILIGIGSLGSVTPASASDFFNDFETDTEGWDIFAGFEASRVADGTNGVPSASGDWHAEQDPQGSTSFGNWGGYNDMDGCASTACAAGATFPENGYVTSVDVYLDVGADEANDTRFDFSSAVSMPDGNFRRDFVFNCGFYNDATGPGAETDRFICSASNNATRGNAFPKNPGRDPVVVTDTTGWFTFQHFFYDDGTGVLAVDLSIMDSAGNVVKSWTLSDPTDTIDGTVGGNRYAWFVINEFDVLAYDDTSRVSVPPPAPVLACEGFEFPMDRAVTVNRVRQNPPFFDSPNPLPFKMRLFDEAGVAVTGQDIFSPPVVDVMFDGYEEDVVPEELPFVGLGDDGNRFIFAHNKWQFWLSTREFGATGTYYVTVSTGDEAEYVVDPTCTGTFTITNPFSWFSWW